MLGHKNRGKAAILFACLMLLAPRGAVAQLDDLVLYVVTCPTCPGVNERVNVLEDCMPTGELVFYDVAEKVNTNRFQRITETLG